MTLLLFYYILKFITLQPKIENLKSSNTYKKYTNLSKKKWKKLNKNNQLIIKRKDSQNKKLKNPKQNIERVLENYKE